MRNRGYWEKRLTQLEEAQLQKGQKFYNELENEYRTALANIERDISRWYTRFADNNQISLVEAKRLLNSDELEEFKWDVKQYIKYGEANALNQQWMKELENASARVHISRLESLKIQLQHQAEVIYGNQLDGLDKLARSIYSEGYYHTAYEIQRGFNIGWDLHPLNDRQITSVLAKPWTTDGRTFKDRAWTNKNQLVGSVHTELTQALVRGDSPNQAIRNIANEFNVDRHKAGRLIMTESAFFASAAQKDCFNDLDVEQFEIVSTLDGKTSEICQELDGKVFRMSEYEIGVTAPPFHPWCRTVTVPYFDDNFGERAARDNEGNTYYVPSDMKYEDWKKSFVDGDKSGLKKTNANDMMKNKQDEIAALKASIMDKHDNIIRTEEHRAEFEAIMSRHGARELNLYNKMADNFADNEYHVGVGGAYYPRQKKVQMNLAHNDWERQVGSNYTGAWNVKVHEEFHQLDHILSQTDFALQDNGTISPFKMLDTHFTSSNTIIGQKMIESIDEDVLALVNTAIDWYNEQEGANVRHLKSLNRISRDAYSATFRYLKTTYDTQKSRAQISMFTDAMGLTTKDRLNPHGNGFWGHGASYNKERAKDGAASETWASFGALFFTGDDETISVIKSLMPKTWRTYSSVLEDVMNYALSHDLYYK